MESNERWRPPDCEHSDYRARRMIRSNGVEVVVKQCQECGSQLGGIKKNVFTQAQLASLPLVDEAKRSDYYKRRNAEWQAHYEEKRAKELERWNCDYAAYLDTPDWQHRRMLVMIRAKGLCEGCREAKATQVHHLTYKHVGDELLFELVAVCRRCHQKISKGNGG